MENMTGNLGKFEEIWEEIIQKEVEGGHQLSSLALQDLHLFSTQHQNRHKNHQRINISMPRYYRNRRPRQLSPKLAKMKSRRLLWGGIWYLEARGETR